MGGGDETGGDSERQGGPVAGADQVQHQVGGGGSAACGKAVLADDKAVGQSVDFGVGGGEILMILPMHGGAVAVQEACAGQHPGACINAADGGEAGGHAAQIADQGAGCDLGLTKARDDDQGIGPCGGLQGSGGGEFDAAGQGDGLAIGGNNAPSVGIRAKVAVGRAQGIKGRGDLKD